MDPIYDYKRYGGEGYTLVRRVGEWHGLARLRLAGKWGFLNQRGEEVIPCIYEKAMFFEEGLARVMLNDKWGFIDRYGEVVIPFKYDGAWNFKEGLALVNLRKQSNYNRYGWGGSYGFINKQGKEVIPLMFDSAGNFVNGLARVERWRKNIKPDVLYIDHNLNYYWSRNRDPVGCLNCRYYNDWAMTRMCCLLKEDL